MSHPFFDAPKFPWKLVEAQTLHVVLYQNTSDQDRIEHIYQISGGKTPLTLGSAADILWREVLNHLVTERCFKVFCDKVLQSERFASAHAAVQAVIEAADTVQKVYFDKDIIFLDRKRLRVELAKLDQQSSYGVLIVRGAPGSGKSWTQKLVSSVASDRGAASVYLFEGIVSTVDEVVEQLFAIVGSSDAVPPRLGTEDAWFRKVCLKLQELAQVRNEVLWVIADDLGDYAEGPRLDNAIRRFFEQFGLTMANPAFAKWFRLVLLDYPDGAVPTKWKNFWCEDRPDENDVNDEVVSEFLIRWAAIKQKNLAAEKAEELAREILQKAATTGGVSGARRLTLIHSELNGVLERL